MSTLYQRSPRLKKSLEPAQYEIVKPPDLPAKPVLSPVLFVWPSVITAAALALILYINFTKTELSGSMVVIEILGILAAVSLFTLPLLVYRSQLRRFASSLAERETKYKQVLHKCSTEFEILADEQRQLLLSVHSHPEKAAEVTAERSSSLWERSPGDSDFLEVRVGTGEVPFYMDIKAPRSDSFNEEPLMALAKQLEERFKTITDCPVTLPVMDAQVIGIVGRPEEVNNLARALLAQIAVSHSPDEVKVAAFFDEPSLLEWNWLRFLPHVWNEGKDRRFIAGSRLQSHDLAEMLYTLLYPRVVSRSTSFPSVRDDNPFYVTLITESRLVDDESLYPLLLDPSEHANMCTVILADSTENLPRQCRLIVKCDGKQAVYQYQNDSEAVLTKKMTVDRYSIQQADTLARKMASVELKRSTGGELPVSLTLLDLLGMERVEESNLGEVWQRNRFPQVLPLPIGVKAGGKPMLLQLHDKIERQGHGPHGLIAGMTGSGKSELLQSLVSTAAMNYHPHDLNFLLIDYKGGGMSNVLEGFPHVVGTLTNLDKQLIQRAKVSLRAELVRRQQILKDAGNLQHIDEYYLLEEAAPLPHLIVLIDEFAELKRDHPDFMEELISIAAIGRTLGLHLILATQKPSGVVDDKIWSNARFRICLRVQDESDSRDMIKLPDAAWINTAGRGYFQVGSGEVFEQLQFAWSSAPYSLAGSTRRAEIYKLALNGEKIALGNLTQPEDRERDLSIKQLQAVINHVQQSAEQLEIERLTGPWLPPLPDVIGPLELADEKEEGSLIAIAGLADDTTMQQQIPVRMSMNEGHLIAYGMPGTGKTTLIQSILMSLATRYTPAEWSGYVVDMGRTMKEYAGLPHIANIITPEDQDRISRLFRHLLKITNERRQLLMESGVKTTAEYRRLIHASGLPDIVIVIDGYYMFKSSYPAENDKLDVLLREGEALGIYFLITANRVGDMPEKLRSSISKTVAFQIADPHDYYYMGLRMPGTAADIYQPPGRGYLKYGSRVLEFQTSLPTPGENELERMELLKQQIFELNRNWNGIRPEPIRELPVSISLNNLIHDSCVEGPAPLGIRVEDLSPFAPDLESGPHFIVGAPMEAGKTSFLTSWILSLAWNNAPEQLAIYTVDGRPSGGEIAELQGIPHIRSSTVGDKGLTSILDELLASGDTRTEQTAAIPFKPIKKILFIDDADVLARQMQDFTLKDKLTSLVRKSRDLGVHIVLSGVPADFPTFGADWFTEIRNCQSGFLLGSRDTNDLSFFRIPLSEGQAASGELPVLPPGQGYYIRRKYEKIKAALPFDNMENRAEWIGKIKNKWKVLVGEEVG